MLKWLVFSQQNAFKRFLTIGELQSKVKVVQMFVFIIILSLTLR